MNNKEMSLFSFLADTLIRVKSEKEFNLALNEFNKEDFSKEFNSVISKLDQVAKNIPKNSNQSNRISYFDRVAQESIESNILLDQEIGEALTWALRIQDRNLQSQRR